MLTNNLEITDLGYKIFNKWNDTHYIKYGDEFCTVSQLLNPPFQHYLKQAFPDDENYDIGNSIRTFVGSAIHDFIDKQLKTDTSVREIRLSVDIDGKKISGQFDYYDPENKVLIDFKTMLCTSYTYKMKMGGTSEWEAQLNCYAYMIRKRLQWKVEKIQVHVILTDWDKRYGGGRHPDSFWQIEELKLWTDEEVETYIKTRIEMFESAMGGFIKDCTPEEKWERTDKHGHLSRMRCAFYCSMSEICPTHQAFEIMEAGK